MRDCGQKGRISMAKKHPAGTALDKWYESKEGQRCLKGSTEGKFLRNRLYWAYMAGWQDCRKEIEKQIKAL